MHRNSIVTLASFVKSEVSQELIYSVKIYWDSVGWRPFLCYFSKTWSCIDPKHSRLSDYIFVCYSCLSANQFNKDPSLFKFGLVQFWYNVSRVLFCSIEIQDIWFELGPVPLLIKINSDHCQNKVVFISGQRLASQPQINSCNLCSIFLPFFCQEPK